MERHPRLHPVILSGGTGSRLWPLSREAYPKQLLPLVSSRTMLQDTALRVADRARFQAPLVICNAEHRFSIAEQMQQLGCTPAAIVLEPVGRNTAPAIAVAALQVVATDPEGLLLVLPADHLIQDTPAFLEAVAIGRAAAAQGGLVTFGITPTAAETGYGYIRSGASLADGVFKVQSFVEKPPREVAEQLVAGGEHYWNSGMFLFPAAVLLAELERYQPDLLAACRSAVARAARDLDFIRLAAEDFARAPNLSIDVAVMERTERAMVVPAELGWTDVGSWSALWEVAPKDAAGNSGLGDVLLEDSRNCYVRTDGALTAVIGLDDVVVITTEDAILVAAKDKVQNVKAVVERLKAAGRTEPLSHRRVHRPWGYYQCLHEGDRFQVKRLTVKPGCKLSLQKHFHRAEHWVVVNGTALVTCDADQRLLRENESIYIPLGSVHRLENPGKVPLNLIEVQSGAYLGEDDIVRFEDTYGR